MKKVGEPHNNVVLPEGWTFEHTTHEEEGIIDGAETTATE